MLSLIRYTGAKINGNMNLNGQDYIFSNGIGDAKW
jgi:hypothetical protein